MDKKKAYKSVLSNMIWSLKRELKYSPWSFLLLLLSIPIGVGLSYAEIYLPSLVVKEVTEGKEFSQAALHIGIFMFLMFVGSALETGSRLLMGGYQNEYRSAITKLVHQKALSMFYQNYEAKETRNLFDRAVIATQQWNGAQPICDMPKYAAEMLKSILCYLLFGTMVSMVSPWLLPILTLAPLVNLLCVRAYNQYEYNNREQCTDTSRKIWYVQGQAEDFTAGKDIRIYGMREWFVDLFRSLDCDFRHWDKKLVRRRFLSSIADLLVILLRDGAAYLILIFMVLRGEITVDKFVLYFAAISSFAGWVGKIVNFWNRLHSTSLKLCDLREFLDLPQYEGTGDADIEKYLTEAPEIIFDQVSFRYDGAEADTLHDISFTIKKGEKVALVGLNGAGKTTLVKLLCGLYLPTSGEIRINGTPMKKFLLRDYYRLFSPVFQDIKTGFFSLAQTVAGTIDDLIDDARVEHCIRIAGLSEKLDSLPEGIYTKLDKQLNEMGTELSGGETQKLMLARALYKDAPILVLDEPTAALDPIAESRIYEEYQKMTIGKSSLFISHRLASTRFCDRILYLEKGVIKEEGTFEELMKAGGRYCELYEMQSCWYREDYEKGKNV